MGIALRYAARSDIGLGRYRNNQDSGYAGPHLLAVCDGMGGHAGGDVASSTALGQLVALDGESHGSDAVALLSQTLREANAELRHRVDHDPSLAGMGTTATILMRYGSKLALAHIGDSRAYLLRDGELTRLTRDHTFVQSLVDEGRITEEEAEQHPQRSIITRVLSGDPDDEPDLSVREARLGDRYVVCSDGLTAVVSDSTLAEALAEHDSPGPCAEALVQMALRGGGPDNITCVVAHVVDASSGDTSTLPEVVGAAAVHGTVRTEAATSSPAARAAALGRQPGTDDASTGHDDDGDEVPPVGPPASRTRWALRSFMAVLVLGLLGAGGYAAYAWSQKQYFVGADSGQVAIYRGLPQDVGPIHLSSVYERQDVALSALPQYSQEQVRDAITADDLADARTKVQELRQQALDCPTLPVSTPTGTPTSSPTGAPTSAATTPSSTPSSTPSGTATAAGTATSSPTSPTASPTGTTVPAGCRSTS
jgi:serine/threonine protein phosphatase PrpC